MISEGHDHIHTNLLIGESSPYLLQHAHNPVDWHPWGEEALKKAQEEDKMLIISIGYAACHWCHVMEHECFEDPEVARIMNENYVAVKVDREERPDVDQVYMNAVQMISGSGGWPLNAFALPGGEPFFAGTYFPRERWIGVLEYFVALRKKDPEKIKEQAENLAGGIRSLEILDVSGSPLSGPGGSLETGDIPESVSLILANIDTTKGGLKRAPKFPMPSVWEYLLHYHHLSEDPGVLDALLLTLDKMAMGGIYDHVGGGFARYSVDGDWHVPHFEKMLYDNAQLVSLYSNAWKLTGNQLYRDVVYETLSFIDREMNDENGGFYSSLDADSEGEEGKFYVWTEKAFREVLGASANAGAESAEGSTGSRNGKNLRDEADDPSSLLGDLYNVNQGGNWEGGNNILFLSESLAGFAEQHNMHEAELKSIVRDGKKRLLAARENRVRPGLDDKILTAWNALMINGYAEAYKAFGESRFMDRAVKNAEFLLRSAFRLDGGLLRNHKDGKSGIHGFLDDYAFTISAFISLYQVSFDEKWLRTALELCEYVLLHFSDPRSEMFFFTHDEHADLIARNMELSDNVIPGSNSEMAINLFRLGHYFNRDDFLSRSGQMLANVRDDLHGNPYYYSNWARLELCFARLPWEVVILGEDWKSALRRFNSKYLPDVILSGGGSEGILDLHKGKYVEGRTRIHVCREKTCRLPVTSVQKAFEQMDSTIP